MAPKTLDEDFKFIMTCIKHSPPAAKPNFEEVAKELGSKSGNACYHRHWALMKKWGMAGGGVGRARKAGNTVAGADTKVSKPVRGIKRKTNNPDGVADSITSTTGSGSGTDEVNEPVSKKFRVTKKAPIKGIKAELLEDEGVVGGMAIKDENEDDDGDDDGSASDAGTEP